MRLACLSSRYTRTRVRPASRWGVAGRGARRSRAGNERAVLVGYGDPLARAVALRVPDDPVAALLRRVLPAADLHGSRDSRGGGCLAGRHRGVDLRGGRVLRRALVRPGLRLGGLRGVARLGLVQALHPVTLHALAVEPDGQAHRVAAGLHPAPDRNLGVVEVRPDEDSAQPLVVTLAEGPLAGDRREAPAEAGLVAVRVQGDQDDAVDAGDGLLTLVDLVLAEVFGASGAVAGRVVLRGLRHFCLSRADPPPSL